MLAERESETSIPSATQTAVAELLPIGATVYSEQCASCHGENGEGEQDWPEVRADGALRAPPHDSSGHTWQHTDEQLIEITMNGGAPPDPASEMPAFADSLSEEEIVAVVEHIRTMWTAGQREYQRELTQALCTTDE
jgi:mono/diheme cytochrome c family protein